MARSAAGEFLVRVFMIAGSDIVDSLDPELPSLLLVIISLFIFLMYIRCDVLSSLSFVLTGEIETIYRNKPWRIAVP